jgi:transcription elongation factor
MSGTDLVHQHATITGSTPMTAVEELMNRAQLIDAVAAATGQPRAVGFKVGATFKQEVAHSVTAKTPTKAAGKKTPAKATTSKTTAAKK